MDDRTRDLMAYGVLAASFAIMVLAVVGAALGWWARLELILVLASVQVAVTVWTVVNVRRLDRIQDVFDDRLPNGA